DRTIGVIIGSALRVQIGRDVLSVIAGCHPLFEVEVAGAMGLKARRIHDRPEREILAAEMCGCAPGRLVLALVACDPCHDVDAPTEIGAVRRVVWTARE